MLGLGPEVCLVPGHHEDDGLIFFVHGDGILIDAQLRRSMVCRIFELTSLAACSSALVEERQNTLIAADSA